MVYNSVGSSRCKHIAPRSNLFVLFAHFHTGWAATKAIFISPGLISTLDGLSFDYAYKLIANAQGVID